MNDLTTMGIRGNTYDVNIDLNMTNPYVKIGNEIVTTELREVRLFLQAYRMGRDHKKNEIRTALGI